MPTHRMHLKGPWQFQVLADLNAAAGDPLIAGTAKMPAPWHDILGELQGRVRFERRFHKPTKLDTWEQVFLVFDGVGGMARIELNRHLLGVISDKNSTAEFEITQYLAPSNLLVVEVEHHSNSAESTPGGLWAPVALEIRSV